MSNRTALLEEFFLLINDTVIDKYFALSAGRSVYLDFTAFLRQHPADGMTVLNNAARALRGFYPGLSWAPMKTNSGFYVVLLAADISIFKWGMHSRFHVFSRQIPMWHRVEIPLWTCVDCISDDLAPELHLSPRSDVNLFDIFDMFAETAHAEQPTTNTRWPPGCGCIRDVYPDKL